MMLACTVPPFLLKWFPDLLRPGATMSGLVAASTVMDLTLPCNCLWHGSRTKKPRLFTEIIMSLRSLNYISRLVVEDSYSKLLAVGALLASCSDWQLRRAAPRHGPWRGLRLSNDVGQKALTKLGHSHGMTLGLFQFGLLGRSGERRLTGQNTTSKSNGHAATRPCFSRSHSRLLNEYVALAHKSVWRPLVFQDCVLRSGSVQGLCLAQATGRLRLSKPLLAAKVTHVRDQRAARALQNTVQQGRLAHRTHHRQDK